MRFAILFLLSLPAALHAAEKRPVTVEDLLKVRNLGETWISPDGESVVYVLRVLDAEQGKYNSDLWLVRVKDRGTWQLTHGPGRDDTPRWSPDGSTIAFLSDRSGRAQVWLLPTAGGEARKLTDHPTPITDHAWAPDGKGIAFLAADAETAREKAFKKERGDVELLDQTVKMSHLHLSLLGGGDTRRLTSGNFHLFSFDWSPDGKAIAYTKQASPLARDGVTSSLHLLNVADGSSKPLLEGEGEGAVTQPRFSPDGKQIACLARLGKATWLDSAAVWVLPARGGKPEKVSPEYDNLRSGSTQTFAWAPQGGVIVVAGDRQTRRDLHLIDLARGKVSSFTTAPGVHDRVSLDISGRLLALVGEAVDQPPDIFLCKMASLELTRLTEVNPQVRDWALGDVEVIRWKSKDGLEIEGLLVKPVGYRKEMRYPLLTYVHGGPALRFAKGFSIYPPGPIQASRYPVQVFAGQGYALFCPNPRGSTAYGEKFRKANVGDWGGKDFEDIMTGIDELVKTGIADPERLGIMGWSYGGYMTNRAITQTNRFKAASSGAGLSNLVSMYGQTDISQFMENYFGGPPWEKRELFEQRSAMTFIQNVKTPTLIQFGERDERVPLAQGQELYTALKRRGIPVELAIYPRQGHNVQEPRLQRDVLTRNVEWFNRWLKK